jgi:hypothetical protein
LGMVMLSRTIFGFLAFMGFGDATGLGALIKGFFLTAAATFAAGVAFFATGVLVAFRTGLAAGLRFGELGADVALLLAGTGVAVLATEVAFAVVSVMSRINENKRSK